jgi:hypothetical protein
MVLFVGIMGAFARAADPAEPPPATLPAPAPTPAPRPRLSPAIKEAIAASLPKYSPLAPNNTSVSTAAGDSTESSDGILHLPKMTVRTQRIVPLTGYDCLTPKGRLELAKKTFPGLRVGSIFGMNDGIALAMLQEEVEYQKRQALADLVKRTNMLDSATASDTNKELGKALARPNTDWAGSSKP